MRQKILYIIWGCLYILCVGLGTLTNRSEAGSWILTVIALLFYVPGGILLYDSLGFRMQRTDAFAAYENQYDRAMEVLRGVLPREDWLRLQARSEA